MIRAWLVRGAIVCAALAVAALLVALSGIVPIGASTGHWAVTTWFLELGKRRSVATHTLGLQLPALDEPWLALKGAGHYEGGCAPCHGSPALPHPPIAASMTPEPPDIVPRLSVWEAEELFYIVKHGIKFTGMPAWPAQQRDDEVRAVVAFLLELPELDAAGYLELVHGDTARASGGTALGGLGRGEPSALIASCARCHGETGAGRGLGAFPKLAGQKPVYLELALDAYASSERNSGIMEPLAAALTARERADLADYYSALPSVLGAANASPPATEVAAAIERGRAIAREGIPSQGVPSCMDCHGPGAEQRNAAYPRIAGQYADYLVLQLTLFNEGRRGGSPFAHLMQHVAERLENEQMRDVAAYYASLVPGGAAPDE
jgi:cytochrome c553